MTVRFDQAPVVAADAALKLTSTLGLGAGQVAVLRGLTGQVSLIVRDAKVKLSDKQRSKAEMDAQSLLAGAGAYRSSMPLVCESAFVDPTALTGTGVRSHVRASDGSAVEMFERVLVGEDWFSRPSAPHSNPVRATLFGIKGGVGRSTAAAALAVHAARQGERVLIVDLDLESPGLGPSLLGRHGLPPFGIVDHLVEAVVGQADPALVEASYARVEVEEFDDAGEVWLAPAGGGSYGGSGYGAKLARLYLAVGDPPRGLGDRIADAVHALEQSVKPTLTLIDSRAGIHDLAAIAVTRLGARGFLFGAATSQTFDGYGLLFARWRDFGARSGEFRERLKMVASYLHGTTGEASFDDFLTESWSLFTTYLYDVLGPGEAEGFSFDRDDPLGPHHPLATVWSETLLRFDPTRSTGWLDGVAWAAMERFVVPALELLQQDRDA